MMTLVQERLRSVSSNGTSIINLGGNKMYNTIEALKVRMHKLQMKDPVGNCKLIRKLQRRIRAMESK